MKRRRLSLHTTVDKVLQEAALAHIRGSAVKYAAHKSRDLALPTLYASGNSASLHEMKLRDVF
jgi:hypothetical protein